MAVQHWTVDFEATPANDQTPAQGAERIRELKETAGSLLQKEHKAQTAGSVAAQGWHRAGSAVVYVATTAPTTRPDGTTTLDANDNGRLWFNTTDNLLAYYAHPDWVNVLSDQVLKTTDNVEFNDLTVNDVTANDVTANAITAVSINIVPAP